MRRYVVIENVVRAIRGKSAGQFVERSTGLSTMNSGFSTASIRRRSRRDGPSIRWVGVTTGRELVIRCRTAAESQCPLEVIPVTVRASTARTGRIDCRSEFAFRTG